MFHVFQWFSCDCFLCISRMLNGTSCILHVQVVFSRILLAPCCEDSVWSAAGSLGPLPWGWRPVPSQCNSNAGRSTSAATSPDQCNWRLPGYERKQRHSAGARFIFAGHMLTQQILVVCFHILLIHFGAIQFLCCSKLTMSYYFMVSIKYIATSLLLDQKCFAFCIANI